jgi:hypothetical protein
MHLSPIQSIQVKHIIFSRYQEVNTLSLYLLVPKSFYIQQKAILKSSCGVKKHLAPRVTLSSCV